MSTNKILLPLTGGSDVERALETGLLVARRFQAHLEVLYVRGKPENMLPYATLGLSKSLRKSVVESADTSAHRQADDAHASFRRICDRDGIPVVDAPPAPGPLSATWREEQGSPTGRLSLFGRLADLIVMPGPLRMSPPSELVQTALKDTGRPLLMVPPDGVETAAQHVAIGWNGSAEAAHAVSAAIPHLVSAQRISILTSERRTQIRPNAADLLEYLAWHEISAKIQLLDTDHDSVAEAILGTARAQGVDMLVVGGYSRSRLRELVFGGVTAELLANDKIPVFMAH